MDHIHFVWRITINFFEALTTCFLAIRLFQTPEGQEIPQGLSRADKNRRRSLLIFLLVLSGTIMLQIWERNPFPALDFVPCVLTFYICARITCGTKRWLAALFAFVDYLLIGTATMMSHSILGIAGISQDALQNTLNLPITVSPILTRLLQLILSEGILLIRKSIFPSGEKPSLTLFTINGISIIILLVLWQTPLSVSEQAFQFFKLVICLLVFIFDFSALIFHEAVTKERIEKRELLLQNQVAEMQIKNQKAINDIYLELRGLKHDFNSHLYTLSGFIKNGEGEKAEEYIESLTGTINELESYHSGNKTLDALLGSKGILAKKDGIRLETELNVPDQLNIKDDHLVTIVGNLLDNSIEACRKIADIRKRVVKIKILLKGKDLVILFQNPLPAENTAVKGNWKTTKSDKSAHGFGLKNIDRMVAQYGGFCSRSAEQGMFSSYIHIPEVV